MIRCRQAQSVAEYSILVSIVVGVVVVLFPMVKRGHQSLVRTAADQVGHQPRAEQDFGNNSGYMVRSKSIASGKIDDLEQELGGQDADGKPWYTARHIYDQVTVSNTETLSNLGITEN